MQRRSRSKLKSGQLDYLSPVCKMIYQKDTGLYTQSAMSLAYRDVLNRFMARPPAGFEYFSEYVLALPTFSKKAL